jgi:acyl transferase domain-containing protein
VAASGIAGMTKSTLALKHKKLFPSLHFNTPSALIDFENSPVYVNTQLRDWEIDNGTKIRRSGLSSFGLSGTNVHLVLEESPLAQRIEPPHPAGDVLIKVSARTPAALVRYLESLIGYLQETDHQLPDIAYALNRGRDDYACRYACVAGDKEQLIETLKQAVAQGLNSERYQVLKTARPFVFLFSGDFKVKTNLVDELSARHPVFKRIGRQCYELIGREQLNSTAESFIFQYALYHLWQAWGITSRKLIGSGTGNRVVAVITERIGLQQALEEASQQEATAPLNQTKLKAVVADIQQAERPLFLEMGTEGVLSRELQHLGGELSEITTLASFKRQTPDSLLHALACLYLTGANINWEKLYEGQMRFRIEIPTYPFEKKRCWASAALKTVPAAQVALEPEAVAQGSYGLLLDQEATATEKQLAAIWGQVLKVGELNRDDDYFDLGGDSLNGTQLLNAIEKEFQVKAEFEAIYTHSTVETLAVYIASLRSAVPGDEPSVRATLPVLVPIKREAHMPLSSGQQRLWFLDQLEPGNPFYNIPMALRLKGALSVQALKQCIDEVVRLDHLPKSRGKKTHSSSIHLPRANSK